MNRWQPHELTPAGRLGIGLEGPMRVKQLSSQTWWCLACSRKFASAAVAREHLSLVGCRSDEELVKSGLELKRNGRWGPVRRSPE